MQNSFSLQPSNKPTQWTLLRKILVLGLFVGLGSIGLLSVNLISSNAPHRPMMPEPITTAKTKDLFHNNPHDLYFGAYGANPFVGGKTWVMGRPKTGKPIDMAFRMNLESGEVDWICSNETHWELPVFLPEKSRMFCMVRTPSFGRSLLPLAKRLGRFSLDHGLPFDPMNLAKGGVRLDFWIQGDTPGALVHMGVGHETTSPSSYADPSPNGNYCRVHTSGDEHLLFDLANKRRIELPPSVHRSGGWWGEEIFIFLTPAGDLAGYDLRSNQNRILQHSKEIKAFFRAQGTRLNEEIHSSDYYVEIGLGGDPSHPSVFLALGEINKIQNHELIAAGWPVSQTITLAIIDPDKGELRLASKIPYNSWQRYDNTGTKAVYAERDRGITVFDSKTNTTFPLLPNLVSSGFSTPFFYKDRILFNEQGTGIMYTYGSSDRTSLFKMSN